MSKSSYQDLKTNEKKMWNDKNHVFITSYGDKGKLPRRI